MSPEVISGAMDSYVAALQHQVMVAKAFYFGRVFEGMEGLLQLPGDVRDRIDQLLWELTDGEEVDPMDGKSHRVLAEVILFNVEERMGMHD